MVMEDSRLIQELRERCPDAYRRLLEEHGPQLRALGLRMLRCEYDAEDALQEALIRAITALDRFDGRAALSTWLYQIMLNTCRMRLRSEAARRRRLLALANEAQVQEASTTWRSAAARDQLFRVAAMLTELPLVYREVVELRVFRELDTSTAAEHLGVREGVVKVRLHRARQMLKERAHAQDFVISEHAIS
jgi:RNA polymerase sigma-70 factor (ECF subfamily)